MSNRFSVLESDEPLLDTSTEHKNLLKKAEKKLREIESLKKKQGDLTKEEAEKVATEQHWHKIAYPNLHCHSQSNGKSDSSSADEKQKSKQKLRREEKEKRSEAARQKKAAEEQRKAEMRAKTQAAKEKYESEKPSKAKTREQEEDYSRRYRKEQDEWANEERRQYDQYEKQQNKKRNFDEMQSSSKSKLDYLFVLGEFDTLNKIHQNVDKTFRILSLKYHPDKNIGKEEWATAMQQHLVNVKDQF
jgi:hypothetical protein